ncbi:MAG: cytochrome c3 family protein, partial [Nitrospirota bacterium]|nr:cytochrome c3 family protein [Nitrospirota bacterium]
AGTTRLTCSGTTGCHGDRAVAGVGASMKGAHHTNDAALKFGTISEAGQSNTNVGLSYRFLLGVRGGEETNWMGVSPSSTVHNEYKGATAGVEGTISTPGGNTISGFCSECHGDFHGGATDIGGPAGTPWLRHPTDITLPGGTTEYAAYTVYNITAPVARTAIPNAISGTVVPGTDKVMCLSCHRAHASANFKMMRWDYKNATLLSGTPVITDALYGCVVCHTSKN